MTDDDAVNESISVSSLATPRPFDDDNDGLDASSRQTLAEVMYVAEGRSLKALAILSLGMKNDDGTPTFNPSVLPWSAAVRPTALKMTAKELRKEVTRRSVAAENVLHAPRPGQWTVTRATNWLEENPIVAEADVAFIKSVIAHRISVAQHAGLVPIPPASSTSGGGNWVGKYPHLRLIHTIIDDNDIKTAYKSRLHVPSGRMAVENRRTPAAIASNVWHMVAQKWNNPSFSPTTSVKDSHSDFSRPINIPFDIVSKLQLATPEKVEEKWNLMNLALKRAITNWERSGQGFGGYTDDEDINNDDDDDDDDIGGMMDGPVRFGVLKDRPQRALDLRRNFFDDRNTYLLYLWDVLDEHDLVQSSMQQLVDGVGSGNGNSGVPSVIGGRRQSDDDYSLSSSKKSKKNSDAAAFAQLSSSIEKHSNLLVAAARIAATEQEKNRNQSCISEINMRINALRDMKREMTLRMTGSNSNQFIIDAIVHEIKGIEEEIASKKEELNGLLATPTKSNRSPN